MKIALGPVLYYWSKDELLNFYSQISESAADIVYLGETVCSRRQAMRLADWLDLAEDLSQSGKEIVLSTQTLIESEADLRQLRKITANPTFRVEANDMGAVHLLAKNGVAFVAGAHLNIYNEATLDYLAQAGAFRWIVPYELSAHQLQTIQQTCARPIETEVWVYGRIPLAFSARCFTARYYDLAKDQCELRCLDHPDGLALKTQEGQPFLTLNGIQTQAAPTTLLLSEIAQMPDLGVDIIRISPTSQHTPETIQTYHQFLQEKITRSQALEELTGYAPSKPCNGYWRGRAGIEWHRDLR